MGRALPPPGLDKIQKNSSFFGMSSLTDSCLVELINNVTLTVEDVKSKLDVVAYADVDIEESVEDMLGKLS